MVTVLEAAERGVLKQGGGSGWVERGEAGSILELELQGSMPELVPQAGKCKAPTFAPCRRSPQDFPSGPAQLWWPLSQFIFSSLARVCSVHAQGRPGSKASTVHLTLVRRLSLRLELAFLQPDQQASGRARETLPAPPTTAMEFGQALLRMALGGCEDPNLGPQGGPASLSPTDCLLHPSCSPDHSKTIPPPLSGLS